MGNNLSIVNLGIPFIPIQIDVGYQHSCALSTNFEIKCWGYNVDGQLGYGDTNNRGDNIGEMGSNLSPIDLGTDFNIESIECGYNHNCAISDDQQVKCWGNNQYGALGIGDTSNRGDGIGEMGDYLPVLEVATDFTPAFVVGVGWHTLLWSANGSVKAFGWGV